MMQHCSIMSRIREISMMNEIFCAWIDMTYIIFEVTSQICISMFWTWRDGQTGCLTLQISVKLLDFCNIKNFGSGIYEMQIHFWPSLCRKVGLFWRFDSKNRTRIDEYYACGGQYNTIQRLFPLFISVD